MANLQGFGATAPLVPSLIQQAEHYLVHVIDAGNKSSNFLQLRAHQFHFSKSASHQNLPPTSQGLKPHICNRAFYNAYITMHVLDRQLNVGTADLYRSTRLWFSTREWKSSSFDIMEIFGATLECSVSVRQMCSGNLSLPYSYGKMQRILQVSEDREL